ncbi:MAG TPA: hypothetical protein VIJ28_16975 [Chloroflexota bacterium]
MSASPNRALRVERNPSWVQTEGGQADLGREKAGVPLGWLLGVVLLIGFAVRWWLLWRAYLIPDADQTIVSLMARHIETGDRPLFYWGQPYTGSGDAYIVAGLFRIFGEHELLPHLMPLIASLAWVMLTVRLAWRLYGPGVAIICGALLAFPSNLLINWGAWAGSGYLEIMALGTGALLLALPAPEEYSASPWRLPLAFFLLGLGLWVQPLAAAYLVAVMSLLFGRMAAAARDRSRWPRAVALSLTCGLALAAGIAPLLIFNLQNDWATLAFLTQRGPHLDLLTVAGRTLTWTGPVLLGLAPATTSQPVFTEFLDRHLALHGLALGLVAYLLVRGIVCRRMAWGRLRAVFSVRPPGDLALLLLGLTMTAGFLASSWGAEQWSATQPRYLLPLYTALPLIVRLALPARIRRWHWLASGLVVILICGSALWVNSTAGPRADLGPTARFLRERGIQAVYGDYWTVVPITYLSGEQVIGVAVRDDLGNLKNNRYSPYLRDAAADQRVAWLVQAGSTRQRNLLRCFQQLHTRYVVVHLNDQVLYDRLSNRATPWWNGGLCRLESQ